MLQSVRQRIARQIELGIVQAWHTARLAHYSGSRLRSLKDELDTFANKPKRPQTAEQMLTAMREITARTVH